MLSISLLLDGVFSVTNRGQSITRRKITNRLGMEPLEGRALLAAAPIHVDTFQDVSDPGDGLTSLREAITEAANDMGDNLIVLPVGNYALAQGQLEIDDSSGKLTIQSEQAVIDAHGSSRVLHVSGPDTDVTLDGLTITGGLVMGDPNVDFGGGIRNDGSVLTIENSRLIGNTSMDGGAIHNGVLGTLVVRNSIISNNRAEADVFLRGNGGGILNINAHLVIENSQLTDNVALRNAMNGGFGGGLISVGTTNLPGAEVGHSVVITNSNISGNSVNGGGGGIMVFSNGSHGTITINNSTVSNNVSTEDVVDGPGLGRGGGIIADTVAGGMNEVILRNSRVTGNESQHDGGGLWIGSTDSLTMHNTAIAGNTSGSATEIWINARVAGDANGDGKFDRLDIVQVLQAGKYNTSEAAEPSEGDFNGDGVFNQFDLVVALQSGYMGTGDANQHTIVSPAGLESTEGNMLFLPVDSPYPMVGPQSTPDGWRAQEIHPASAFRALGDGPLTITGVAYRPDESVNEAIATEWDITFNLSTTEKSLNGLSTTFADNYGSGGFTQVFSGKVPMATDGVREEGRPHDFDYVIEFDTPYVYDPEQGNLLVESITPDDVATTWVWVDADNHLGGFIFDPAMDASEAQFGGPGVFVSQFMVAPDPTTPAVSVDNTVPFANYVRFVATGPTTLDALFEAGPFPDELAGFTPANSPLPGWDAHVQASIVTAGAPPELDQESLIVTVPLYDTLTAIAHDADGNELGRLVTLVVDDQKIDLNAANAIVDEEADTIHVPFGGSLLGSQPAFTMSVIEATGIYRSAIVGDAYAYAGGVLLLPLDDDPSTSLQDNILTAFQENQIIGSDVVGVYGGRYLPNRESGA